MSSKDYYEQWLKIKKEIEAALAEDKQLQELAVGMIGIKPQLTAVEIVARVYCKYCKLYNQLCECYDQMAQVQRRPSILKIIDAITCRLMELKVSLQNVESFEYTYPDNALQQMIIVPQDIEVLCPFHYPFEIRQQEMQYIIDEIFSGNRIGDPEPTPSEIERKEQERLEEEERLRAEKEDEIKRKMAMGEDISTEESVEKLSPKELEARRLLAEYLEHVLNIQRMERSRSMILEKTHKENKDADLYLELAGLKKPLPSEHLQIKAASFIQKLYRQFMKLKREHLRLYKLKAKLGMIVPSWSPPSAKQALEKVKEHRRKFRHDYYKKWVEESIKEKARVLRLREGNIMEDISDQIRFWFQQWYRNFRVFDEFPWPEEGGSILIVKGETMSIEEYIDWRTEEEKRLKAAAGTTKTKEQIKAEKIAAREEAKRLALDAKLKHQKWLLDYKKARLNPDNDPGIYYLVGTKLEAFNEAWNDYQIQWKLIDNAPCPNEDVFKGFITSIVTEDAYFDAQLKLRSVVDDMMRLELNLLKNALKKDYAYVNAKIPITMKRIRPKKVKAPKPDKMKPEEMFQILADEGIVRKYPRVVLDDYWGDRNYGAADLRGVPWTPSFPPPGIGDVKEQIRLKCILAMGSSCENAERSHLLVGPKGSGKRTLVYAIATETNALLVDLSPKNVYNKFPGPKNLKEMFRMINIISRLMQPTVIFVENADKMFYKSVPKEEKVFDPQRLQKDFFKDIVKPIDSEKDKILVLGTASEPWLCRNGPMFKAFPSTILIPRTDFGSISYILTKVLMQYHGMDRDFDVQCVAQTLRGFDINSIRKALNLLLNGKRVAALYHKPLQPMEVLNSVMEYEDKVFTSLQDYDMYWQWYIVYSPWGARYTDLMQILQSQLAYKLKADKKKKK
ncbi:unnamed protein product [Leptidea sinapis]|uniref:ATPase AAA-type core domain-containing protein n=1 Tax=Leptidea sinapis TaxID=189913 RepID=A0A5E4PMJ9_9NEOP|nr:unnamed protein product [Leptidea sinapis]